jgi:hypothetical protein
MTQTYKKPELPSGTKVNAVVPKDLNGVELGPKTRVVCINRGDQPYFDKCDGRDYVVPPGFFEVEHEVADHFRLRSVVPGSRDPVTGSQENYIAIIGIDPPEQCEPFTRAVQDKYEQSVEALDRGLIEQEQGGKGMVVSTASARARTAGGTRRRDIRVQQNDSENEAVGAMAPPTDSDAARAGRGEAVE